LINDSIAQGGKNFIIQHINGGNTTLADNVTANSSSYGQVPPQFLTYADPRFGISLQYPADWFLNSNATVDNSLTFDSNSTDFADLPVAEVNIGIDNSSSSPDLAGHMTDSIRNTYENNNNYSNFRIIGSTVNSQLAGHPAYKLEFTYTFPYNGKLVDTHGIETGTIIDSKVYWIQAIIDENQYLNYQQTIQEMVDSFRVTSNSGG
jgi:photosystem II reaction center protein PsbP